MKGLVSISLSFTMLIPYELNHCLGPTPLYASLLIFLYSSHGAIADTPFCAKRGYCAPT